MQVRLDPQDIARLDAHAPRTKKGRPDRAAALRAMVRELPVPE